MGTTVGDLLKIKGVNVETCGAADSVYQALRHMARCRIGCLAVTTKTGKLAGIVSERDCLWKVIAPGKSIRKTLVKEAMTPVKQMKTVTPVTAVDECMELMTGRRHRHLPVLADKKLVGLISIGDVVKYEIDSKESTIQSLEKYITGTF